MGHKSAALFVRSDSLLVSVAYQCDSLSYQSRLRIEFSDSFSSLKQLLSDHSKEPSIWLMRSIRPIENGLGNLKFKVNKCALSGIVFKLSSLTDFAKFHAVPLIQIRYLLIRFWFTTSDSLRWPANARGLLIIINKSKTLNGIRGIVRNSSLSNHWIEHFKLKSAGWRCDVIVCGSGLLNQELNFRWISSQIRGTGSFEFGLFLYELW